VQSPSLGTVHGTVFAATFDFKSCLASGSINLKKTIQPSIFLLCRGRMGYVDNRVKLESKEEKLEGINIYIFILHILIYIFLFNFNIYTYLIYK
jgi:hypothetical protein